MNVRDFECRSYEQAMTLLRGKHRRAVCYNTELLDNGTTVEVQLYGRTIVELFKEGKVTINSCGYRTKTTKDRINRCLPGPWILCQYERVWNLWNPVTMGVDENVAFVDGMMVPWTEDGG